MDDFQFELAKQSFEAGPAQEAIDYDVAVKIAQDLAQARGILDLRWSTPEEQGKAKQVIAFSVERGAELLRALEEQGEQGPKTLEAIAILRDAIGEKNEEADAAQAA
jgi:hypothetical protein